MHEFGLNYRLPDVLCALGSQPAARGWAGSSRGGRSCTRGTTPALSDVDGVALPVTLPGADPAWHLYPLRVLDGRRRELYEHLRATGIGVQVNYIPAYWHPVFADLGLPARAVPGGRGVLRRRSCRCRCSRTWRTPMWTG